MKLEEFELAQQQKLHFGRVFFLLLLCISKSNLPISKHDFCSFAQPMGTKRLTIPTRNERFELKIIIHDTVFFIRASYKEIAKLSKEENEQKRQPQQQQQQRRRQQPVKAI